MPEETNIPPVTEEAKPEEPKKKETWWSVKTTRQKVYFIIFSIISVFTIFFIFTLIFPREFYGNEFADVFIKGQPNAIALLGSVLADSAAKLLASVLTILVTLVLTFVINFIINLMTFHRNNKTQTVGSLVRSCIRYFAIILDICLILTIWGVDVASVIAGLGVLTLIIGLGCQNLIQDIVSGLFIVFDDYYSVGDTVIIDGFRGDVYEIGLRSTKVKDFASNIKSISNSNISTVVNLSRGPSAVMVEISVGLNEDLRRVEAVLLDGLPKIKERIPQITSTLDYKGVASLNDCGMSLFFLCFCKEGDRFQVDRDVRRDIYLLLKENQVTIPFKQVVVNGPDPTPIPHATPEQAKKAEAALKKNRDGTPIDTGKKKKGRRYHKEVVSKALDETSQQFGDVL